MKTRTVIDTNFKKLQFGYWDEEKDKFIPVQNDEDIEKFCMKVNALELIVRGILMSFDQIESEVKADLKQIWERLDRIESRTRVKMTNDQKLYIGVEYDEDQGWIVTIPKIYKEGIEYETESHHEFFKDAKEEAKTFSKNTGLPIKVYNKQGKEVIE